MVSKKPAAQVKKPAPVEEQRKTMAKFSNLFANDEDEDDDYWRAVYL